MNKLDAKKETKSQTRAGGDRAREGLGLGQGQGGGRRGAGLLIRLTGGNGRGVKRLNVCVPLFRGKRTFSI